jgi:alkylation response protein AidB-like acyl-CoA dehydrogenase
MDPVAVAEEVAPVIAERAAATDASGVFPAANVGLLRDRGYLRAPVPVGLGGLGADLAAVCAAQAVLAGACASTALAVNMHLFGIGAAAEAHADGEPEAQLVLRMAASGTIIGGSFTDAATGLNVRASSTPAERVEGGYVIRGRKAFCSLAPVLDVFYGTAGVTDGSGLLLFAIGRDAPGLRFVDTWDTMAMRGTGSWDVVFDDVFVPEILTQLGAPWASWDRRTERMLAWFCCTVAAVYLGIAEAARDFAVRHTSARRLGGMQLPLARQPGAIFAAGEIDAGLRSARALLFDTIARRAATLARGDVPTAAESVAVKYVVTNTAVEATQRCLRMVGGSALYRRLPIERMFRDVQAGPLHPPTNDLALEALGRAALGIPPDAAPRWGD